MTDSELMLRAAKAAGIRISSSVLPGEGDDVLRYPGVLIEFNPLVFDRDAFQVLIGAGMQFKAEERTIRVEGPHFSFNYHFEGSRDEAARRAIVEAAACMAGSA